MSIMHTQQKNIYTTFARLYDRLMSEKKYSVWEKLIAEVVKKYAIPKGICLDVACGTGKITGMLLKQGFRAIGIDKSEAMLEIARRNFPAERFIKSDICDFSAGDSSQAVMAVSFYDSLNYLLTDEEMSAMFKTVARNLAPGAIFLFDMNTRDHVTVSQNNKPRFFEDNDFYAVFRFGGEDRMWILDIDLFAKRSDGGYDLHRERHTERGYDKEDIAKLLEKSGLTMLEVREEQKMYEDGKEHLSRLYFVTRK